MNEVRRLPSCVPGCGKHGGLSLLSGILKTFLLTPSDNPTRGSLSTVPGGFSPTVIRIDVCGSNSPGAARGTRMTSSYGSPVPMWIMRLSVVVVGCRKEAR